MTGSGAVPAAVPGPPAGPDPPVPSAARWLVGSDAPWQQLVEFGPPVFAATARLRFVPDPERPGQPEADVAVGPGHPSDLVQAQRALRVLAPFTRAADACWYCLWEGYPYAALPGLAASGVVVLPHRRYLLHRAPLRRIAVLVRDAGGSGAPPAFVWPDDRAWCFASDVDPHWAGIGASRAAVDALLADPRLDVVEADPARPQPAYR